MVLGDCAVSRKGRFYLYGLHGFFYEVIFTCLFELFTKGNRHLHGYTSLFSFFIYGSCALVTEHVFIKLYSKTLLLRLLFYVPIIFFWEYSTGYVLRIFGACPWNYTEYAYNIHGLITLEYLPGWALLAIFSDCMYKYMMKVRLEEGRKSKQT